MKKLNVSFHHYPLQFKVEAKTSRNTLTVKDSWIVLFEDNSGQRGYGECAPIWGLSPESQVDLEAKMLELSSSNDYEKVDISRFPTLNFGLETAKADLTADNHILYDSPFSRGKKGIPINGLVWMGDLAYMKKQIAEKLDAGFTSLKLKVGSQEIDDELAILEAIRKEFNPATLEIRLDANGAFEFEDVPKILRQFSEHKIHSIEQPIEAGNWDQMAQLCANPIIPIALDEELIRITTSRRKRALLDVIKPQYIILKPSLLGGLRTCDEWVKQAKYKGIGWWVTSMLESNIGLSAIAQWVSTKNTSMKQGLGTGMLYSNNVDSPLVIKGEELWMSKKSWQIESALKKLK